MKDEYRLQFCRDDDDITGDIHAEVDATEVRVWDDECVIVAVGRIREGAWEYRASDYGPEPRWDLGATFTSWQDALAAFGYGELASAMR